MLRHIRMAMLALLTCQSAWAEPLWPPETFSCYYGEITAQAVTELKDIDLLIVHPGDDGDNLSREKIQQLRDTGKDKTIVGYVSVGEDDQPPGGPPIKGEDTTGPSFVGPDLAVQKANNGYPAQFLDQRRFVFDEDGFLTFGPDGKPLIEKGQDGHPDENGVWGSFYVKTDENAWRERVFSIMDELVEMGADGFFLDTVDTASPWGDYGWTSSSMLDFVEAIRERYPDKRIVANRGLFYFNQGDRYGKLIDAVLFESLLTHYNWKAESGDISPWAKWHVKALVDEVIPAQQRTNVHLLVLDYLNPEQPDVTTLVQSDRSLLAGTPHSLSFSHPSLKVTGWTPDDLLPETQPSDWPTLENLEVSESDPGEFELVATFSGKIPEKARPDLRVTSESDIKAEYAMQLAPAQVRSWKRDGNKLIVQADGLDKNQRYTAFLRLISKAKAPQTGFGWTSFTTADSELPPQIKDLSHSSVAEGLQLSFSADSSKAKSYRIYHKKSDGLNLLKEVTTSPAVLEQIAVKELAELVVVGIGPDGRAGYPSLVHTVVREDVIPPPPPGAVTVSQEGDATTFSWEGSPEAFSYRLYVVPKGKGFRLPLLTNETKAEVERVLPGEYKVFLTAVDEAGNQSRPGPSSLTKLK